MKRYLKFYNSRGLTLVELLVSLSITITLMTVVVAVMIATFRGASKSSIVEDIRQNGNSALTQITKQVQFADSFDGAVPSDPALDVNNGACTTDSISYDQVSFTDNDISHSLECSTNAETGETVLRLDSNDVIDPNKAVVLSCSLTCTQASDTDTPIIGINFTLKNKQADAVAEKTATLKFTKSIKMRYSNQ